MSRLHVVAALLASVLAFAAGPTASAQVYKWVDERGQINYSNQLPADEKLAAKATAIEDRVSFYTPDPALVSEIQANRQQKQAAAGKPETWRPAVVMLGGQATATLIAYEPPVVEYPYWGGGGFHQPHRHRPNKHQSNLQPGAIAGTIVGMNGFIPGSTVSVPGTTPPITQQTGAHRPHRPAPLPSRDR